MAARGVKVEMDLVEVEKLSSMQATDSEMAAWFGVNTRTIERRRLEPEFAAAVERGRAKGRLTIRRAQLRLLEGGNVAMAIWLGKNYLAQSDHITEVTGPSLNELTGKQLAKLFRELNAEQLREVTEELELIIAAANEDLPEPRALLPAPDGTS